MASKRIRRSDEEWLELIQKCRTSGLSDTEWCEANGIDRSQLSHKIRKLRSKSVSIPDHSTKTVFQSHDIVEIRFDQTTPADVPNKTVLSGFGIHASCEAPAIRVTFGKLSLEISNHAAAETISNTLSALRMLC